MSERKFLIEESKLNALVQEVQNNAVKTLYPNLVGILGGLEEYKQEQVEEVKEEKQEATG